MVLSPVVCYVSEVFDQTWNLCRLDRWRKIIGCVSVITLDMPYIVVGGSRSDDEVVGYSCVSGPQPIFDVSAALSSANFSLFKIDICDLASIALPLFEMCPLVIAFRSSNYLFSSG